MVEVIGVVQQGFQSFLLLFHGHLLHIIQAKLIKTVFYQISLLKTSNEQCSQSNG